MHNYEAARREAVCWKDGRLPESGFPLAAALDTLLAEPGQGPRRGYRKVKPLWCDSRVNVRRHQRELPLQQVQLQQENPVFRENHYGGRGCSTSATIQRSLN